MKQYWNVEFLFFSATVMVCSILPREQNLHPSERLTTKFLTDFNEVANEVNFLSNHFFNFDKAFRNFDTNISHRLNKQ